MPRISGIQRIYRIPILRKSASLDTGHTGHRERETRTFQGKLELFRGVYRWWGFGAAVVHLNFRAGSTFPVPVCTVLSSMDRTSRWNKVDAVRLNASYRLNLLLLKGQICVSPTLPWIRKTMVSRRLQRHS